MKLVKRVRDDMNNDTITLLRTPTYSNHLCSTPELHHANLTPFLTLALMPETSPPYLVVSLLASRTAPFLRFFALSNLKRCFTLGLRCILGRFGVRPLFFWIWKVMERRFSSSSSSSAPSPPSSGLGAASGSASESLLSSARAWREG